MATDGLGQRYKLSLRNTASFNVFYSSLSSKRDLVDKEDDLFLACRSHAHAALRIIRRNQGPRARLVRERVSEIECILFSAVLVLGAFPKKNFFFGQR